MFNLAVDKGRDFTCILTLFKVIKDGFTDVAIIAVYQAISWKGKQTWLLCPISAIYSLFQQGLCRNTELQKMSCQIAEM